MQAEEKEHQPAAILTRHGQDKNRGQRLCNEEQLHLTMLLVPQQPTHSVRAQEQTQRHPHPNKHNGLKSKCLFKVQGPLLVERLESEEGQAGQEKEVAHFFFLVSKTKPGLEKTPSLVPTFFPGQFCVTKVALVHDEDTEDSQAQRTNCSDQPRQGEQPTPHECAESSPHDTGQMRKFLSITPDDTEAFLAVVEIQRVFKPSLERTGDEADTQREDSFGRHVHPERSAQEVPKETKTRDAQASDDRLLAAEAISHHARGHFEQANRNHEHGVHNADLVGVHATVAEEENVGRKGQREEELIEDLEQDEVALDFLGHGLLPCIGL